MLVYMITCIQVHFDYIILYFFIPKFKHIHYRKLISTCCLNLVILFMRKASCNNDALQWCHNECHGISNHQPHDCLLNCLFRPRSKKTSSPATSLAFVWGNSPVTGEFPAQRATNAKNVSSWWHHHVNCYVSKALDSKRRHMVAWNSF